jgi:hypothetical protein
VAIAVGGDRQTVDVLHHEIRKLPFGRAAVEQLRDVRMTQRGEDLPLGDEAPVELSASGLLRRSLIATSRRYSPSTRSARYTTPMPPRPSSRTTRYGPMRRSRSGSRRTPSSQRQSSFENPEGRLVRGEQCLDLGVQLGVVHAAVAQPRATQRGIEIERVLEDFLDLGAARG